VTEIGKITEDKGKIRIITPAGESRLSTVSGWDHFSK
jgi:thiamine monophosphate kinase